MDALGPELGGIGRYTWELCKGLARSDAVATLRFYGRNVMLNDPAKLLSAEDWRPAPRSWPFRAWRARRARSVLRSTLVHGPNYFLPMTAETGVITIHDLSVFRFPETHPAARVRAFERLFVGSLNRAAHVITDTETVKRELVETFAVQSDRVTAVPLGVDSRFRPRDPGAIVPMETLGPGHRGYGLCVSTIEPRKKIAELLCAWRQLPARVRDQYPLVLAGGAGWRNDTILEDVRRGEAEGWLRWLGFVAEADLPALYAGARLFLYPSSYEGFGLPPIEAMASGVPVVTSNRSCLPEVSGDAARYVDPDDVPSFTAAIEECLTDDRWRSSAIEKGLERARQFTWDRCVDDTVAVYKTVSSLY